MSVSYVPFKCEFKHPIQYAFPREKKEGGGGGKYLESKKGGKGKDEEGWGSGKGGVGV